MTPERKRSILVIALTFILGIAIGVLATGLLARKHYHNRERATTEQRAKQKEGFVMKLLRVMDANEKQQTELKPIIENYVHKIDSVQEYRQAETKALLLELQSKIKPLVSDDQFQKLQSFNSKTMGRSLREPRHRHH